MELEKKVKERTYKQMLLVSMISMTMMFAGLTSAYVISTKREDWVNFEIPQAFYISTILILLGSLTFYLSKRAISNDKHSQTTVWLSVTLALGLGFVFFQLEGFSSTDRFRPLLYRRKKQYRHLIPLRDHNGAYGTHVRRTYRIDRNPLATPSSKVQQQQQTGA
ncbi:MAG: hypothetical protein U5K51_05185 [Flavobacteriaceae bacterium]|nr:hypothetical protein [Flavobacteriaceae bacterium]